MDQYHEEKNGQRTVINLGRFDKSKHMKWIDANPTKRPKPKEYRKHVSHFYSDGDVCDITGDSLFLDRIFRPKISVKCKDTFNRIDNLQSIAKSVILVRKVLNVTNAMSS